MTIEKLPSGSYRIKQQYRGQRYSVTVDHKPTKPEAIQLLAPIMDSLPRPGSFEEYANSYIEAKRNVLSPSTVRGYESMLKSISKRLKDTPLSAVTAEMVQIEINRLSIELSPKTVYNIHGFISAVLRLYRPNMVLRTTLPQKVKSKPYIPSPEEIKAILDRAKGTRYEVPFWLACFSLRRSEICALTIDDLSDDNLLTVNKAKVLVSGGGTTIKKTKTQESTRMIPIPAAIADLIRKNGCVYEGRIGSLLPALYRYQDELGISRFKLHAFRHYFASAALRQFPEADVKHVGGWSSGVVLRNVYDHSLIERDNNAKREITDSIFNQLQ